MSVRAYIGLVGLPRRQRASGHREIASPTEPRSPRNLRIASLTAFRRNRSVDENRNVNVILVAGVATHHRHRPLNKLKLNPCKFHGASRQHRSFGIGSRFHLGGFADSGHTVYSGTGNPLSAALVRSNIASAS
jgi:hypothetical protein